MKKNLLLLMAVLIGYGMHAQQKVHSIKKWEAEVYTNQLRVFQDAEDHAYQRNGAIMNDHSKNPYLIPIGQSNNAFSFLLGGPTSVWLEPNLGPDGAIAFIHRSLIGTPPAATTSGHLLYDYSTDGGATWQVDVGPIYNPDENNLTLFPYGRYPQGVIYNPTNLLADAYITYHAPATGCGTTTWCSNVHGTQSLTGTLNPYQESFPELPNNLTKQVPDAFHINTNGNTFMIHQANENGTAYADSLTIRKGTFNATLEAFEYVQSIESFPTTNPDNILGNDPNIPNTRIAFSTTNSDIGYCLMLTHVDYEITPHPYYQAVLIKTTDGGDTWSLDDPITVPLDDIPAIKYELLDDNDFANIWSPPLTPAEVPLYRDSVTYNTAFLCDLVVDADNNPHIITTVHMSFPYDDVNPTTPFAATTEPGLFAACHLYSLDGGTTWDGSILENLNTFRGEFPYGADVISEDNRPQAGVNFDGTAIIGTWLETDTTAYPNTGNANPDIHISGCDLVKGVYTTNLLSTSALIPGEGTFGSTSYYFWDYTNDYKIPVVYMQMGADALDPVQYYYIDSMMIDKAADFNIRPVYGGIESIISPPSAACAYSSQEAVEIEIRNYGVTPMTNFDFSFVVDGKDTVTETVTASIPAGTTATYTFSGTADLSAPGVHYIRAFVQGVDHRSEYATSGTKVIKNLNGPAKPTLELVQVQGIDLYITSDITNPAYDYQWYEWDGANSIELTGATDTLYTPVATGDYFLKVLGSDTCIAYSDTITFIYVNIEDASVSSIDAPTDGCYSSIPEVINITIENMGNTEIPAGLEIGYSFENGTVITETTESVIPVTESLSFSFDDNPLSIPSEGTFSLKVFIVSDDNPANDTTSITFTKDPKPDTPTIILSVTGNTLISNAPSGNQWYDNRGPIVGATSNSYTPNPSELYPPYYVIVRNQFGCQSDTSNKIYNIGIDEIDLSKTIKVFPNPADEYVRIESNLLKMESIQVFNMYGSMIREIENAEKAYQLHVSDLQNGSYHLRILTDKGVAVKRFNILR